LAASLQAIKDEQEYLVIRERVHRNSELCSCALPYAAARDPPAESVGDWDADTLWGVGWHSCRIDQFARQVVEHSAGLHARWRLLVASLLRQAVR
jgi:hypothetical protein